MNARYYSRTQFSLAHTQKFLLSEKSHKITFTNMVPSLQSFHIIIHSSNTIRAVIQSGESTVNPKV